MVTKHNVLEVIENYLKSNHIRYNIIEHSSTLVVYELNVSSLESFIQVEYNLDDERDDMIIQFYTKMDNYGISQYHDEWNTDEITKNQDSIESYIEQLIEETKRINSVISKIELKIQQIKEICEENNLDVEEFIQVVYDF